jgi:anaerobic magnesium-protoporphyrin IX monomethyl ester cyclase
MSRRRVAILGHVVPQSSAIRPVAAEAWGSNYNRIFVEDGTMVDHLAFLKRRLGRTGRFSVWELHLCAPLLLRSHLERAGAEVLVVNSIDPDNEREEFGRIQDFAPDILVLSTTFILSPAELAKVVARVRCHLPATFVVAGGHHVVATLRAMSDATKVAYLKASGLDAFVNDAQGEATLAALVCGFPDKLAEVKNLVLRTPTGAVVVTPRQPEDNPLSDEPVDLRGLAPGAAVHLRTARGCAFSCGFCSYPTTAGKAAYLDLDTVRATLRATKRAEVDRVLFVDDTFNVPKERFSALLDILREEAAGIPWYSFLRCQFVDEGLVARMRNSGCEAVFLGIESGADAMLTAMGKQARVEHYRRGITWLRQAGIKTVGSFVIGYPGETAETVQQTRAFIETAGLDYYFVQLFYYLQGTPVHQRAAEYGLRGKGLLWSHRTMTYQEADRHMAQIFLDSQGPIALHQDYNLWELALLRWKGMSWESIDAYRREINKATVRQMQSGQTAWTG